jgi:hypothetical protein
MKNVFLLRGVFSIFAVSLLTTACQNTDVYDTSALQDAAKAAFPVEISPNQTWNMIGTTSLTVSVNETYGEKYTIKVYDSDPASGNAKLLTKGNVANGEKTTLTFDYPLASTQLYVGRMDSENRVAYLPFTPGDTKTISFGTTATRANTGEVGSFTDPAYTEKNITEADVNALIKQATDISDFINANQNNKISTYFENNPSVKTILIKEGCKMNNNMFNNIPSGVTVIVEGNVGACNTGIDLPSTSHLYIAKGATLSINSEFHIFGTSADDVAFVNFGTFSTSNGFFMNSAACIYNAGTLNSQVKLEATNGGELYNAATGVLNVNLMNTDKFDIINYGKIQMSGTITFANSYMICKHGSVFTSKDGSTTMDGVNPKIYNHTSDFKLNLETFNSDNCEFYTDCGAYVTLNKNPGFNPQKLVISAGGSLVCNWFTFGRNNQPTTAILGHGAILKNTNTWYRDNSGQSVDATGPGTGTPALCILGGITYQNTITGAFKDNVEVQYSSITHTGNGIVNITYDTSSQAYTDTNDMTDIPVSECNVGNVTTKHGEATNPVFKYTYAFEDMTKTAGDYDFNDVVLKVTAPVKNATTGKNEITVYLVAAGAAKNLTIHFREGTNGTAKALFDGKEVHDIFGVAKGQLVNTGAGVTAAVKSETIEVSDDFSMQTSGDFFINDGTADVHIPKFTPNFQSGDAPYALAVAADWDYPREYVKVTDAYPTSFETWSKTAQTSDWYSSSDAQSSKVIQ